MNTLYLPLASALAAIPLFLGVALATVILMRRISRRRRAELRAEKSALNPHAPAPLRSSVGQMPSEIERAQVELHEMYREYSARLDTKISALMHLIRQADERIAELDRQSGVVNEEPSIPSVFAESATNANDECREILQLAEQGFSAATIANRTDTSVAEVETVLAACEKFAGRVSSGTET